MFRVVWLVILTGLLELSAVAQVSVGISLEREKYLLYEPFVATVEVNNYSAQPVKLADEEKQPWLRFEIVRKNGEHVVTIGPGYLAGSVTLNPGQTISKAINLVPYYNVRDLGDYRLRALVKVSGLGGAFASTEKQIEVVGGRQIWTQTAGVPGEQGQGSLRTYTLMTLRMEPYNWLYARVEDIRAGLVFGVIGLGAWVTLGPPQAAVDKDASLHVLHQIAPRNFRYAVITLNGAVTKRESYTDFDSRPELKRGEDGQVKIVGGEKMAPSVQPIMPGKRP